MTDLGGGTSWTASAGVPTSDTGSGFPWTAPGTGGVTVRLSASNGGITVLADIFVVGQSLAIKASSFADGNEQGVTLVHVMENQARRGRRKSGRKRSYALTFNGLTLAQLGTIRTLYDAVGELIPFSTYDPVDPSSGSGAFLCYFDSAIGVSRKDGAVCSIQVSFRVKEA